MRYARLGESGLLVSRIALGVMTFGSHWGGPLARVNGSDAKRLVDLALDRGVTFFDTADIYHAGQSETILGEALGARRKQAVIATKVGMRVGEGLLEAGLSARHVAASAEASLKRLGTDWIDVYIAHRPDPLTPLEETLAALDRLVRDGKVRYLGFSNWPAWLAAKAFAIQKAAGYAPFVTGQMYYSLIARDIEHEYVPFALDAGVGTMVWSPLSSGFLSGKYTREDPSGANGRLATMDLLPFDREKGFDTVDVLRRIAQARDAAVAAVALSWLIDTPSVATVVAGASNEAQLEQNLAAADLVLTAEERSALDTVSRPEPPYPMSFLKTFLRDAAVRAAAG